MARLTNISRNLNAFLDMIAYSEGTIGKGDDGYNIIFGGSTFHDYSRHPKLSVRVNNKTKSTAAGRYQMLYKTAISCMKLLKLTDFSPVSQDRMAIQLIKDCKALVLIEEGKVAEAIQRCSRIWVSFPVRGTDKLLTAYNKALTTYA